MKEPTFGVEYSIFLPGEPVPKSTMKPPVIRKRCAPRVRAAIVQSIIEKNKDYAPLYRTQQYQKRLAQLISYCQEIPTFDKDDCIKLTFTIYKGKHARGDLKNIEAAVEDAVTLSGKIPDDGQVTCHGETRFHYFSKTPGVLLTVSIDPYAGDLRWITGWFSNAYKKVLLYAERRGIIHSAEMDEEQ